MNNNSNIEYIDTNIVENDINGTQNDLQVATDNQNSTKFDLKNKKVNLNAAKSDLKIAKSALFEHKSAEFSDCNISDIPKHCMALCKGNSVIVDDKHGIRPMLDFITKQWDLTGYSVADIVVGKAVATLFVYSKIKAVYAHVLSKPALEYLNAHDIEVEYGTLVDNISNRAGDGICPMELCVANIDDANKAYFALKNKVEQMMKK